MRDIECFIPLRGGRKVPVEITSPIKGKITIDFNLPLGQWHELLLRFEKALEDWVEMNPRFERFADLADR